MNIKPTELHVALPKIMEHAVANLNQQSVQKNVSEQEQLVANMAQKSEETLQKSNAVDQPAGAMVQDGGKQGQQESSGKRKKKNQQEQEPDRNAVKASHPYKGKHIDFKA